MKTLLVGLVASLAAPVSGTFVVKCYSRLIDERADPIVNPGAPASHVHVIAGGSGFNFSMDYNQARASKCSTCNIKEDLSNYWTPKLYYHAKNGSFISVPIMGDDGYGNMGGMAIYYNHHRGPNNDVIHPFPPGFRMLAGTSDRRAPSTDVGASNTGHLCDGQGPTENLPTTKCSQIRSQINMPSCWDGKNLDSADHKSHMSYPIGDMSGPCPSTHPVRLMSIFYEVTYSLVGFEWYSDQQPFVYSNGDATGYGFHGDFVNGWDTAALQRGIDNCATGVPNCEAQNFDLITDQGVTQECKLPAQLNEPVSGVLAELPGCNAVSYGPASATPMENCNPASTKIVAATAASLGYVDVTSSKGFKYIGCGTDNPGSRTLTVAQISNDQMTVENCIDFCKSKGTTYAGLEYMGECYCGNTLPADRAPVAGVLGNCNMKCRGNSNEICGGAAAISLYQACTGGACTNSAKRMARRLAGAHHAVAMGLMHSH
ncbi:WSC-domain-containing protein [Lepidopterella palustris CBS 459.81]|uniref:WSC-domain-containing protein n=1 Tax=Lepidopterella palustris CBS 459.81 TaxID=1314670 RepID=A0A8E2DW97_9PEZI|nr:WSC-domain-containing protein [Lepidopterella palustris CBS 459.81]